MTEPIDNLLTQSIDYEINRRGGKVPSPVSFSPLRPTLEEALLKMVSLANMGDLMIEGLSDAGGGGAQRWAWDRGETIGMVTTGAFIVGGLILPMFLRNQLTDILARGMFHSGAAIAGWVTTEKVLNLAPIPTPAALNPGGSRRALGEGRYVPPMNGLRSPEVARHGVNPNTGEEIKNSTI